MIGFALQLLIAYGLGSISGSLLLGRLKGVDVRTRGSGNPGAANAMRTLGWRFALGVLCVDILKGVLAAGAVPAAGLPGPAAGLWCGLAAVAGHIWPVWHGFRGGKGVATAAGVILVVAPWALLTLGLVWMAVLTMSGYTSMASLLACAGLIPALAWFAPPGARVPYLVFACLVAALVGFAHRGNMARLLRGEEHRFDQARLFGRRRRP